MMSNNQTSIAFTFSLLLLTAVFGAASPTAYDLIQSYDLPVGILPKGITHYDIDTSSGKFNAYFNGSCSFSLEGSYQLKYKSTISGNISKDKLTNLSGVSVKVLFVWLNIVEVRRKGENLDFSVGIASVEFGIDNFYESPQCGCGFDCNDLVEGFEKGRNVRTNPFVSSAYLRFYDDSPPTTHSQWMVLKRLFQQLSAQSWKRELNFTQIEAAVLSLGK